MELHRKATKCGCKIIGNGSKQFPLQIEFCTTHSAPPRIKGHNRKKGKPVTPYGPTFPPFPEIEVL